MAFKALFTASKPKCYQHMNADAQNKGYKIPSYQQQSVYIVILFSILTVHIKKKGSMCKNCHPAKFIQIHGSISSEEQLTAANCR